jgi:hypothetical protein
MEAPWPVRKINQSSSWRRVDGVEARDIDLRAAAMPIIIKTAGFDVSPIERWQIRTPLRAVT